MRPCVRIALLLWDPSELPRRVTAGAAAWARADGGVVCTLAPCRPQQVQRLAAEVDGFLVFHTDPVMRATLAAHGRPAIGVSARHRETAELPLVIADGRAAGALAAAHLIERGLERLIYAGVGDIAYAQDRGAGFAAAAAAAGVACQVVEQGRPEHILPVIRAGSGPAGILAAHDGRARQLLDRCLDEGLAVPDEVALLGVDDTQLFCELAPVPLSSVDIDGEAVGRHALAVLVDWCRVGRRPPPVIRVPPTRVVARASTDCQHAGDPVVGAALAFIRRRALHGIGVDDVAQHLAVPRRTLEAALRRHGGRSPYQLILDRRFAHACEALQLDNATIAAIARRCGFADQRQFARAFAKRFGCTPSAYRQLHREQ